MAADDFSKRKYFPGETGNPFDIILFSLGELEHIPTALYLILLATIAHLRFWGNWPLTIALAFFFISDWLLLYLLPVFKRSYGPAKPPSVVLMVLRLIFTFLPAPLMLIAQFIGTGLVIYGFWVEPHRIHVTRQVLKPLNFKPVSRPLRLLHLGDLHIERITRREELLNQLIKQLAPDLILFSGDFLNLSYREEPTAMQAARKIVSEWQAPLGVYVVTGSPAVDYPEIVTDILAGLSVHWLKDENVKLDYEGNQIGIVGITCTHRPHQDAPTLKKLLVPQSNLQILLYHTPDLAPQASEMPVDLQLSGHTHGGQVRLPLIGALFTGSLYNKRFEAGRYLMNQMVLYISRGIGLEGAAAPRVRFLCPPEIILWEISAPDNQSGDL
ncbi:MAG: metallophosphoesterase [Anaerolineae bacterium]|nr:metallophosphoesterase [Anaerolineae bacterium]